MATTIITKNGSGAPAGGDLSVGELAVDLANKRLYTKDGNNDIIELGTKAGSTEIEGDLTVDGTITANGQSGSSEIILRASTNSNNTTLGSIKAYSSNTAIANPIATLDINRVSAGGGTFSFSNAATGDLFNIDNAGRVDARSFVVSGSKSAGTSGVGEVALTTKDGNGNSNVTFNHTSGVPAKSGNAGRISVNTDATSNCAMSFSIAQNVTADTSVSTTKILDLKTAGAFVTGKVSADTLEISEAAASTAIATMENTEVTASHVLQLTSGGGGTGTKILECIGGAGGPFQVLGNGDVNIGGDLTDVGNITSKSVFRGTSSTGAGTPTFSFSDDTNTGMYHVSANKLGFSANGVSVMSMQQNKVGIGTAAGAIGGHLEVKATATNTQSVRVNGTGTQDSANRGIKFAVDGTNFGYITIPVGGGLAFGTGGSAQRAIIDTSGHLLLGITTSGTNARLRIKSSTSGNDSYGLYADNSSADLLMYVRSDGLVKFGDEPFSPYNNTTSNATNLVVTSSGQLARSTSSRRYKENIQDMKYGLDEVMALRPVTYTGKNDGDKKLGGFIAEEVHDTGMTEFVEYNAEGQPDALAYSQMTAVLAKAIQEQQELIKTLQAEVAALKGA